VSRPRVTSSLGLIGTSWYGSWRFCATPLGTVPTPPSTAADPIAVPRPAPDDGSMARTAGRGGLAVATAKLYFIGVGLVQQILLPRVLGLGPYGALSSVLSAAGIIYNPVVTASIQGSSRAVAQAETGTEPAVIRRALAAQTGLAVLLGGLFFLLAGSIADLLNAPHLVAGLRIASGVVFFYGLYAPLIGVLNGRRKFAWQAGFDIVFGTLRTVLLVVGGYWGGAHFARGVEGAMLGFVVATAFIWVGALGVVGPGRRGDAGLTTRRHLAFIGPVLLGQTLLNLLFQADLSVLRAFASGAAMRAGLGPEAADPLVGAYRMTQLFSFLPYQLLLSITFVLFPLLAQAHHAGDREAVARYVSTGVRIALLVAGGMVSVTSGLSGPLFRWVFTSEAAELGTGPMQLLSLGLGAFALFGILTTVLNSLGRERASALVTALALVLVVGLCWLLLSGAELGPELLWKTAVSTSAGLVVATVGAAWLVFRTAGAVVAPLSLLRVAVSMGLAILVGRHLPGAGKLVTPVYAGLVGLLYAGLLLLTRELGRADLTLFRTAFGRRRA
jgi:stage V sporulation protein B